MTDYSDFFARQWPLLQQADLHAPRVNPTFHNPPFGAADLRVLIARLSPFSDVDRSTPHLFLFDAVRRAVPQSYVDFAFFPPRHDRERLKAAGVPLLVGIQSARSIEDFDLVLISNAYTLELVNLPVILLRSGIPPLASQRGERWPPLVLGGSNASASQAIVAADGDSLVDAVFFGEGEGEVSELVRALHRRAGEPKRLRLEQAAQETTGLWVTGGWPEEPVEKAILPSPRGAHLPINYPLLNGSEAGTARLQITYGCPAFCSFCFEGYDRKPYREVPRSDVLQVARQLKWIHGCDTLSLYSFNFNTHREILPLLIELNRLFDRVRFTSQRVDLLQSTPGLLEAEVAADKRSFTLGVEGISARLRAWLHKSLTTEQIVGLLDRLLREKIRSIKLFYILTGHEEAGDLAEFHAFVRHLRTLRRRHNPGVRVTFSCGLLVRMPFTPLRHDSLLLDRDDWKEIVGRVKSSCETNGFEFRMAVPWDDYCVSQVLALAGYGLTEPLIGLAEAGHCYEEALPPGYWDELRAWLEANGRLTPAFLGQKDPEYDFAFDFVRSDVSPDFLYHQFQQAQECVDEGYCLGSHDAPGRCLGCGACRDEAQRRAIVEHEIRSPADEAYLPHLRQLMRTKWRLDPVYAHLRLPPVVAGVGPEWMDAWVLRNLLVAFPMLTENLLAVEEALFTAPENRDRYANVHGETVYALKAWDPDGVIDALAAAEADVAPGLEVLGTAEGFVPGQVDRMRLSLVLPKVYFPNAGQQLRDVLREAYVPCNLRREGAGYQFDLPARALKKRILFEGRYEEVDDGYRMDLVVSPKFDLLAFLRAFEVAERYRLADVAVSELEW
ncbi:MAG: radical SAM protein [Anaerolineae bacterium]|jgi:hypothetical protein